MSKKLLQSLFIIPLALSPVVVSVACGKKTSNSEQTQDETKPDEVFDASSNYEVIDDTFKYLFYTNDYIWSIPEQYEALSKRLDGTNAALLDFLNSNKDKLVGVVNQFGADEGIEFTVPTNGFKSYAEYVGWLTLNIGTDKRAGSIGTVGLVEIIINMELSKLRANNISIIKDFMKRVKASNRNSFKASASDLPLKWIDITNLDNTQIDALTKEELIKLLLV